MSLDVLLECPRTSFRDVLRVNVTERVWHSPPRAELCICISFVVVFLVLVALVFVDVFVLVFALVFSR